MLLELEEELLVLLEELLELLDETLVTLDIGMLALPSCTSMSALPFWIPVMVPVTENVTSDVVPLESTVLTDTLYAPSES